VNRKLLFILSVDLLGAIQLLAAPEGSVETPKISITESSIKIGDVELRTGPRIGKYRYISLEAAGKAVGPFAEKFLAGQVLVYPWPKLGIQMEEGMRGPEQGKVFKFLVFLESRFDQNSNTNSGQTSGHVQLEGIDLEPTMAFDQLRERLQEKGYKVTDEGDVTSARKSGPWGQITIYKSRSSGRVGWIEVWCL
jgi:hypothetical protein